MTATSEITVVETTRHRAFNNSWFVPAICGCLIALHLALALCAAHGKSATADEPLHAVAGWTWLRLGDFRLAPRDPPLFGYWQSLGSPRSALKIDLADANWQGVPERHYLDWIWATGTLYRTKGNDADAFIWRGRLMMSAFDALLGVAICVWAYQLRGRAAALIATMLFAFDPNFLAHGTLIKNDVAVTCGLFATAWILFQLCRRVTIFRVVVFSLIIAATCNLKFSGLIAFPIAILILVARSLSDRPWPVLSKSLDARVGRLASAGLILLLSVAFTFGSIWALYGFRYAPSPTAGVRLNFDSLIHETGVRLAEASGQDASTANLLAAKNRFVNAIRFADAHRLMPQAWLFGLLYTFQSTWSYQSFLLGEFRTTGWWYYFPLTFAFKSATATLAACALAGGVLLRRISRQLLRGDRSIAVACLLIPFTLYGIEAVRTNTNLGIRHILPMLPFLFVAVGCILESLWSSGGRIARSLIVYLGVGLAVESCAAFPNYIAFFNLPAGGSRGGIRLLADSNLDWGQDLPALAAWRKSHPKVPLYLSYFGMADPGHYGIDFKEVPRKSKPIPEQTRGREYYVAVSATNLQGPFLTADQRAALHAKIENLNLDETINGTIYIFHHPARPTGQD